jgi:hypothetical protein
MKKIITILVILALAGTAAAERSKVGSVGAQFLKIGVGSRYQGMGEASVATVNDIYAMYWNPAGLADIENAAISFTNVNWILDVDLNYIGTAKYFEGVGVFGVSATVLSMDEQEVTRADAPDGTGETYDATSYTIGLSYGRQLTRGFSFGASVKYIGEKIWDEESQGYAFDFGTQLYTGIRSLRLGMSISNMGPDLKFSGPTVEYDALEGGGANEAVTAELKTTPYDLPLVFRFGIAYDFQFGPKSMLTMCGELKHPNDNEQQGAIGAEFGYDEKYFLRGGYKLNYEEEQLSFGGGLVTSLGSDVSLVVDYSWQDLGRLEQSQRFSIGFTF